jgi:hypothetical protein
MHTNLPANVAQVSPSLLIFETVISYARTLQQPMAVKFGMTNRTASITTESQFVLSDQKGAQNEFLIKFPRRE